MPKRKRSEEDPIGSQAISESNYTDQPSEEETVVGQPRAAEEVATSGSSVNVAETGRVQGSQSLDATAEALLASSPFWALLMDAGYTWW